MAEAARLQQAAEAQVHAHAAAMAALVRAHEEAAAGRAREAASELRVHTVLMQELYKEKEQAEQRLTVSELGVAACLLFSPPQFALCKLGRSRSSLCSLGCPRSSLVDWVDHADRSVGWVDHIDCDIARWGGVESCPLCTHAAQLPPGSFRMRGH